jgi:hypothetical protein
MKMLEEILSNSVPHHISAQGKAELAQCEVFLIDNVAEYLYAQTDQDIWNPKTDFPCLAPPFPSFWMEYGRPSRILSSIDGVVFRCKRPLGYGGSGQRRREPEIIRDGARAAHAGGGRRAESGARYRLRSIEPLPG